MIIDKIQNILFKAKSLEALQNSLDKNNLEQDCAEQSSKQFKDITLNILSSARPLLIASIFARWQRPMLIITSGEESAKRMVHNIAAFVGKERVINFPERTDILWKRQKADLNIIGQRTKAIGMLEAGEKIIVVASARSLMRKTAPKESNTFFSLKISCNNEIINSLTGEIIEYNQLSKSLIRLGYKRLDAIDGPGTFSLIGDTATIFGAGMSYPVKVEFFGDEVDAIRQVLASTGQSIRDLAKVSIWPAREFFTTKNSIKRLEKELFTKIATTPQIAQDVENIKNGIPFDGQDLYLPYLFQNPATPISYIAPETLVVINEPRSLFDDMARRFDELESLGKSCEFDREKIAKLYSPPAKMNFGTQQRIVLASIMAFGSSTDATLSIKRPNITGSEEKLFALLHTLLKTKTYTLLSIPDIHVRKEFEYLLTDNHISFSELIDSASDYENINENFSKNSQVSNNKDNKKKTTNNKENEFDSTNLLNNKQIRNDVINITNIDLANGYIIPESNLALISIYDLSRSSYDSTQRHSYKKIDITEITFPFKPGDYVVHSKHGIALFDSITTREIDNVLRDYILLKYAHEDRLFVPIEQIGKITRYVGPEGKEPKLTSLNSADWTRAIKKARKSAKRLAFDLVDLYSRRSTTKGFSYSPDDGITQEMESIFPYEETQDQLNAINDVKADMESERPMDRLICGDVGFGKTEVALRAAFKAINDNKQVMFLCPTTILAQQHFNTFFDRFDPFGIKVEVLSRFKTSSAQKKALEGFASGKVDMLVGTHRLLSRDVNPANLGLVIIDEEQRFGVAHKEHLKNLREYIDVLSLSATPIPRTLQMSLSGVRDMSLIITPPPNRQPVKVYVGEWDEDIVATAIRHEIQRKGQCYYVSNRVRTIQDARERVLNCVPEACVEYAHGAMTPSQLEDIMERFSAGQIDVLVSTTIIESGLDNPHTNTLIIEDSQRLGLAQLYQLKGRVGRSMRQAYAYFLFPPGIPLTEEATARLEAIGEFTELGSGMKVAMRDLEIRGAGTLLGAEQSGNMSAVGFDLFASMIAEAVSQARGEEEKKQLEVVVNLPLTFVIDEEYIPGADDRVLYYRKLAASQDVEDVEKIRNSMKNLFGELPQNALNLCNKALAQVLARENNVTYIGHSKGMLHISPISQARVNSLLGNTEYHKRLVELRSIYYKKNKEYRIPTKNDESSLNLAIEFLNMLSKKENLD